MDEVPGSHALRSEQGSAGRSGVDTRDAGLDLIRRANRWLIAGAVAASGALSVLVAHAFHGRVVAAGRSSSSAHRAAHGSQPSSSHASSSTAGSAAAQGASGAALQPPAQAPTPAPAATDQVVSGGS